MNITLDEIRSKAPEGATHYNDRDSAYYKMHRIGWEIYMDGIGWVGVLLGSATVLKPL